MHFDNIQITNEATFEVEMTHFGVVQKYIGTQTEVVENLPEQINISTVAMNGKNHKQTDNKMMVVL